MPDHGPVRSATGAAVGELLPLPRRVGTTDLRFDVQTPDEHGRRSLVEACRTVGWTVEETARQLGR